MTTDEKIEEFKFRYFILSEPQCMEVHTKHRGNRKGSFERFPTFIGSCIYDLHTHKRLLYSKESMISKTFSIYKKTKGNKQHIPDFSFLEPYKTNDKIFLLQCDKVKPRISEMGSIYAIDNIWLAYSYKTKNRSERMCINSNIFGRYKLIGSREMNIHKILVDL